MKDSQHLNNWENGPYRLIVSKDLRVEAEKHIISSKNIQKLLSTIERRNNHDFGVLRKDAASMKPSNLSKRVNEAKRFLAIKAKSPCVHGPFDGAANLLASGRVAQANKVTYEALDKLNPIKDDLSTTAKPDILSSSSQLNEQTLSDQLRACYPKIALKAPFKYT